MKQSNRDLLSELRDLLTKNVVHSQEEIREVLQSQGWDINQSKISRVLHKLGAVKTKNEKGEIVYTLPKESLPVSPQNFSNLIVDIVNNEVLIVIITSPGSASLIARTLDHHHQQLNILGTIAGDDTIVVIPKSIKKLSHSLNLLQKFLSE